MILQKELKMLFNIKECLQSNSTAKVDFGTIFNIAASENRIDLTLIFNHHREANLYSSPRGKCLIITERQICIHQREANLYSSPRGKFVFITERQSWCLNQYFQGPDIQWEHYVANSSFCQVLLAILVVFQNGRYRKYNTQYITLLVIDLCQQTWCKNIHC